MSGYKRVNYYELCRLCTSTEGTKIHIYKEEGRRRQLPTKIKRCLPLKIQEYDLLPKMICNNCVVKLEEFDSFRSLCSEAEKMLQDFRSKLKYSASEVDGKLQVYVKDSQPIFSEKQNQVTNECIIRSDQIQRTYNAENESDKRIITHLTVPSRIAEETHQLPLQCTVPLKLNGVTSSAVPVNVENISSLMQVVPNDEMPRIQQFKLPIQTEMAVINESNNTRFSITIPNTDPTQKDGANVIQSLQCAVNEGGNINVNKMTIQSTVASSAVPFNNSSVAVSFSSSDTAILQNTNVQDMVTQVDLTKEDSSPVNSCSHCGKILNGVNEICNHTVVRPATSTVSCVVESNPASVIQTAVTKFSNKATKRLYSEENGFKCDICEKPFRKKEHLFQHRKLHSGDRPYVCGSCGKSFSRKEHLFRHTLAHTGEKRHSCNLCGKTFSRKDNLHKHSKIHGITGPYECELCGKSFIVQHYFLMHQANHSTGDSDELPFQCDICKKGFVKEEFLNRHKVRHRVRNTLQVEENDLPTINSVAILSPTIVQQSSCTDETVYITAQPATFSLTTSVASNTAAATQTPLFSTDLTTDGQLLDNYRHLNSTTVSS